VTGVTLQELEASPDEGARSQQDLGESVAATPGDIVWSETEQDVIAEAEKMDAPVKETLVKKINAACDPKQLLLKVCMPLTSRPPERSPTAHWAL
jgi:hypothetical protein